MYVVLGNTHPGVIKNSGEEYRDHLKTLAAQLGVSKHLSFINKFVSEESWLITFQLPIFMLLRI